MKPPQTLPVPPVFTGMARKSMLAVPSCSRPSLAAVASRQADGILAFHDSPVRPSSLAPELETWCHHSPLRPFLEMRCALRNEGASACRTGAVRYVRFASGLRHRESALENASLPLLLLKLLHSIPQL